MAIYSYQIICQFNLVIHNSRKKICISAKLHRFLFFQNRYRADDTTGYVADVRYEGKIIPYVKPAPAPVPVPAPVPARLAAKSARLSAKSARPASKSLSPRGRPIGK